ncbi:PEP-CTERM sorting domain-containing protein [Cyanobacterium aponinum AL20118]|uniref:PEP-CTERM sorting domain-containing protein n=1 Tax=Cyanobacterium aponinum AL20115 TaxID=3090662 RepID=A0AAF0ZB83_9CHRO|nr:PEP-CTERM sorting domain-containing protein [Cyanobacterium aponinum]WPF87794.1 PEP-CTERM sorting domain-containing protein [Cyanobacterium aponinum AL20115]
MNKLLSLTFGVSSLTLMGLGVSLPVQALNLFTSCDVPNTSDNIVTGVSSCNYLPYEPQSNQQDFINTNPITVNEAKMFEQTDWSFLSRYNADTQSWGVEGNQGASITENKIEGNWGFNDLNSYSQVAMLFKDGNGTALTTYLLSSTDGTFKNPFYNPSGSLVTEKEISHISFYVRGTSQPVPEPLTILGTGLALGLGGLFKSKQKQKSVV